MWNTFNTEKYSSLACWSSRLQYAIKIIYLYVSLFVCFLVTLMSPKPQGPCYTLGTIALSPQRVRCTVVHLSGFIMFRPMVQARVIEYRTMLFVIKNSIDSKQCFFLGLHSCYCWKVFWWLRFLEGDFVVLKT